MSIRTGDKTVIQLSTNASYVDIGVFLQGNGKKGLDASRHQFLPLYANLFLPEKFLFSERAGLLIIPMPRIIYPYFTVRTSLRMGQTIPILK
jgi:hypothetical protein